MYIQPHLICKNEAYKERLAKENNKILTKKRQSLQAKKQVNFFEVQFVLLHVYYFGGGVNNPKNPGIFYFASEN